MGSEINWKVILGTPNALNYLTWCPRAVKNHQLDSGANKKNSCDLEPPSSEYILKISGILLLFL